MSERQPPRRGQTQAERDLASDLARRERERLERLAAPHEVPHEVTGQYEGEELEQARARRPTDVRLSRLERKGDELAGAVNKLSREVGEVVGQLKELPRHIETISNFAERTAAREDATFRDGLDAKKTQRKVIAKIVGGLFGGGLLVEIIHLIGSR